MPFERDSESNELNRATPWRTALKAGETAALFNDPAVKLVTQVAATETTPGVSLELGALRLILARLLTEQSSLEELVPRVARVVSVTLQAIRLQRVLGNHNSEELVDAINVILAEIDQSRHS